MSDTYRLRVSVSIVRHNETGAWSGDQLNVSEETEIPVESFLEAAGILGRFHDLAQLVKK